MVIKSIYLKNFKGLKKVENENGEFSLDFPKEKGNIILFNGENGYGKSTLLENLHPYSEMIERDTIDSIIIPAEKRIEIEHEGINYHCVVEWGGTPDNIKKTGKIYKEGSLLVSGDTEEGNENKTKNGITEYNYQIEKIFGKFDKFRNSVFLKQGSADIVNAKPTERLKIINRFMPSLEQYDISKDLCDIELLKLETELKLKNDSMNSIETNKEKYLKVKELEQEYTEEKIKEIEESYVLLEKIKDEYNQITNKIKYIKENKIKLEEENNSFVFDKELETKIISFKNNLKIFNINNFIDINNLFNSFKNMINEMKDLEGEIKITKDEDIKLIEEKITEFDIKEKENIKNIEFKKHIENNILILSESKSKIIIDTLIEDKLNNVNKSFKDFENYNLNTLNDLNNNNFKLKNLISVLDSSYNDKINFNINEIEKENNENIKILNNYKEENIKNIKLKTETELNIKNINEELIILESKLIKLEKIYTIEEKDKVKKDILNLEISLQDIISKKNILNNIGNEQICPTCNQEIDEKHKEHLNEKINLESIMIHNKLNLETLIKEIENNIEIQKQNLLIENNIKLKKENLEKLNSVIILDYTIMEKEIIKLENKIIDTNSFIKEMNTIINCISEVNLLNFNFEKFSNISVLIKSLEEEESKNLHIIKEYEKKLNEKQEIEKVLITLKRDNEENIKNINLLKEIELKLDKLQLELKNIKILNINIEDSVNLKNNLKSLINDKNNYSVYNRYIEIIKSIFLINITNYKDLNIEISKEFIKIEEKYLNLLKDKNEYDSKIKELEVLEKLFENDKINKIKLNNNLSKILEYTKEIENFKLPDFIEEKYLIEKEKYLMFKEEFQKFIIDKKEIEKEYERYLILESETKTLDDDIFQWKKLKTYSERIKKAVITETFTKITNLANKILKNEGTISLEIAINHVNDRKFEIIVKDKTSNNIIKDVSLLSGAEKMTVAKALNLALSQSTTFKTLWLDESDGSLSPKNKAMFVDVLKNLFKMMELDEIFVISHMPEVESMADKIYNFNDYINKYVNHSNDIEEINYSFEDL